MRLILPDAAYRESFLRMAESLHGEGHWYGPAPALIAADFADYLAKLDAETRGQRLGEWQVASTEHWMLEGDEIAGRLRFNYTLAEWMKVRGGHIGYDVAAPFRCRGLATEALRQALDVARRRGLAEILITCDDTNLASATVIERNGGQLQDRVLAPGRTVLTRRYRIVW